MASRVESRPLLIVKPANLNSMRPVAITALEKKNKNESLQSVTARKATIIVKKIPAATKSPPRTVATDFPVVFILMLYHC